MEGRRERGVIFLLSCHPPRLGIFVLGLPFALVRSGYLGLILMVLSAWVCNHTGRILVACLYEEQEQRGGSVLKVRVRHSYQDIVEASCRGLWPRWPGLGGFLVNLSQVIELLMTCTLYLVVSTSLLSDSLSRAAPPRLMCSLLSLMFLLPCLLLTDLRSVSTLSLLCSLAHVLISLLVMLYCLSQASSWSWSSLTLPVVPEDFLVSVGVIIFSYTSQIFLPPLEGSMEDRGQFNAMLGWTHGTACIMKTTFSLLAVLTWGAGTSEVITKNLPSDLRPLVNMCLLAKALLSFPLPFYSAAEILQSCLLTDAEGPGISRPALLARAALLITSYLLSLLVPRFSLLMGLTGSVTGAAMTLILPCLCHLRLRRGRLTGRERLADVCILSTGVICSVSGGVVELKLQQLLALWAGAPVGNCHLATYLGRELLPSCCLCWIGERAVPDYQVLYSPGGLLLPSVSPRNGPANGSYWAPGKVLKAVSDGGSDDPMDLREILLQNY
ncbi:GABA and glycine transporter Solute carrier family 32 member 1 Vesicular [Takifugu flavidus]|uniref:Vesicular inhibitory amino acid transporter n=1 Tax=Takifugu flavidus TaxID=433684 RepID=A0A5C6NNW4_9TELE|nr:GABA and glycine transporter Solute carrier family 32 member 1 Vesicular [Takifugu flavidus]